MPPDLRDEVIDFVAHWSTRTELPVKTLGVDLAWSSLRCDGCDGSKRPCRRIADCQSGGQELIGSQQSLSKCCHLSDLNPRSRVRALVRRVAEAWRIGQPIAERFAIVELKDIPHSASLRSACSRTRFFR